MTDTSDRTRIAFVCVQNAGRSQMAYAFARREVADRDLEDTIEIVSGGTRPAAHVHEAVVRGMADVGIDVSDRRPRDISVEELQESDYVITMGCAASDVCPAGWGGETRDWDLEDPDGKPPAVVDRIRDEVERQVIDLIEELTSR